MQESGITAKGQTTLPKQVRLALGIAPGDRIRYLVLDGGEVRILRARPLSDLAGSLRAAHAVSLAEMEKAIAEGRAGQSG